MEILSKRGNGRPSNAFPFTTLRKGNPYRKKLISSLWSRASTVIHIEHHGAVLHERINRNIDR
jgi:hypothetical protein